MIGMPGAAGYPGLPAVAAGTVTRQPEGAAR
jgi:hypothetical protein